MLDKCTYYSKAEWATHARSAQEWAQRNYLDLEAPFKVHNVYSSPSWIERFRGTSTPAIQQLIADIKTGRIDVELRENGDLEKLLSSSRYGLKRAVLKSVGWFYRWKRLLTHTLIRTILKVVFFL